MNIYFSEEEQVSKDITELMEKSAKACLDAEEIDEECCELSVTFVSKEEIRALNRDYRENDKVTDVLSFPQYESVEDFPEFGEICLGDVVICRDKAIEQAEEFGHSYEREIIYLFTHSVLHLLGYDHMEDDEKALMRTREEEVLTLLGLGEPKKGEENIMNDKELFRIAVKAMENAYAPFSNFKVGAALLSKTGEVFTGVNVENSSYGATICAERTACTKAVSEGAREFEAIAITGNGKTAWPCGICRQFLYEFAPELKVITGDDEDHLVSYKLNELLKEGFRL